MSKRRVHTNIPSGVPWPSRLVADIDWFRQHEAELVEKYGECYCIVYNEQVIGTGATWDEALDDAERNLPPEIEDAPVMVEHLYYRTMGRMFEKITIKSAMRDYKWQQYNFKRLHQREVITELRNFLPAIIKRPSMYGIESPETARVFLIGFHMAYEALGLTELRPGLELRAQIKLERGWELSGQDVITQMKALNRTKEDIITEALEFEIAILDRWLEQFLPDDTPRH